LKGSFSRYEFQRDSQSGLSSVKQFKTVLPAAAKDVYYRDEIGNISTSHLRPLSDSVEVDLRPRYELFQISCKVVIPLVIFYIYEWFITLWPIIFNSIKFKMSIFDFIGGKEKIKESSRIHLILIKAYFNF